MQVYWGGKDRDPPPLFPTVKVAHSGWLLTGPSQFQHCRPHPAPLSHLPSQAFKHPPATNCPKQAIKKKIISPNTCIPDSFRFSISESRGSELISRVYCIIHATSTCRERTGCCCNSTKPQMHHEAKATRHKCHDSISPRTIAKFICKKIHCNVLCFRPPPPKACGFS